LPRIEPSQAAVRAAESAEWPGNIRQLCHAVQAAVIRAAGEAVRQFEPHHLFPNDPTVPSAGAALTFQEATRRFQATLVHEVLVQTHWNVNEAAKRLDLARSHVYNLIRAFGLAREG
jgi:Nif-specific regulatory protein